MSSGPTPPNVNTSAVTGIEASSSSRIHDRAESSLPSTIASDEIGVVISRSSVCFSRSRLIAPAVEAGASTSDDQRQQDEHRDEQRPPDLGRRAERAAEAAGQRPLHERLDHPREAGDEQQVDRDDHERPLAAHPAAQLLDGDGGHAAEDVAERAEAARPAGRRGHWTVHPVCAAGGASAAAAASTGSWAVTWRNSSSRSLAAPGERRDPKARADGGRQQPRRALVVAVEPDLDRARPRAGRP